MSNGFYSCHVEHYVKTEPRKWIFQEYDSLEAHLQPDFVEFEISLADLYEKVEFEVTEHEIDPSSFKN
jgi:Uma2 family endonuclease